MRNPSLTRRVSADEPDVVTKNMKAARRFSGPALEELATAKIIGVRAGTEHRYTGVWVVVVEGRVFVRPWNDKPTGWYRAFLAQPLGGIQLAGREIAVRARQLRGGRLRDAVTRAYAGKYDTKASEKWVRGFAEPAAERPGRQGAVPRLAGVQPPGPKVQLGPEPGQRLPAQPGAAGPAGGRQRGAGGVVAVRQSAGRVQLDRLAVSLQRFLDQP